MQAEKVRLMFRFKAIFFIHKTICKFSLIFSLLVSYVNGCFFILENN